MKKITRRTFVKRSVATGGLLILPSGLRANSPNGRVCTAHIGCGGKGEGDLAEMAAHPNVQVIGVCDVDTGRCKAGALVATHASATFFRDYRVMLDELGGKVDALTISTPDHTHYPATVASMKLGKHVYTQKPLTHKVAEARDLMNVAREKDLVTQMGIQVQSSLAYRTATAFVQSGVLGKVSKVYVWSFKNWGYDGAPYEAESAVVPDDLDWNLWLGTAPLRPYLEGKYVPGQWRRYLDFGCGTLGDMGVHIFDTPFRSLELKDPRWVEVECRAPTGFGHPEQNKVHYGFKPTKYTTNDFTFTWWDGEGAPRGDEPDLRLPEGDELPQQGAMFVGEEGRMLLPHSSAPKFYPQDLLQKLTKPDLEPVNHYHQWIDAILGKAETTANFDYAAPLVESLLLGVAAAQFPGRRLEWDAANMVVVNLPEANALLKGDYRKDF